MTKFLDPFDPPKGREYLWGASQRPEAVGEKSAGGSADTEGYIAWWAHTLATEKLALEDFVDWALARAAAAPQMRIYHYGAYEVSALRRLAMRHGTREAEATFISPPPSPKPR